MSASPKDSSVVKRFLRDADNYAKSRQALEEAKAAGQLTSRDLFLLKLIQPGLVSGDKTPAQPARSTA